MVLEGKGGGILTCCWNCCWNRCITHRITEAHLLQHCNIATPRNSQCFRTNNIKTLYEAFENTTTEDMV